MPSLVEIGLLVLEKKILKNFQYFLLFCDYLPLEKSNPLDFNNLESPPLRMICAKFGYNWPSGFGEEVENVKVYRQTDDRQQAIRIAHLSFQFR